MVNIWTYVKEKNIYIHTHNYLNDEAHCCCLAFKAHYDSPQCILQILPPNTQLIPANHAKNIYGTFLLYDSALLETSWALTLCSASPALAHVGSDGCSGCSPGCPASLHSLPFCSLPRSLTHLKLITQFGPRSERTSTNQGFHKSCCFLIRKTDSGDMCFFFFF